MSDTQAGGVGREGGIQEHALAPGHQHTQRARLGGREGGRGGGRSE